MDEPEVGAKLIAARSFLFVPADRPERFAKAATSGADVIILDLEDAVAPERRPIARRAVGAWLGAGNVAMVRVNATGTEDHSVDLAAVHGALAVMLAKAEPDDDYSSYPAPVVPLVETATGVLGASRILAEPNVIRPALGTIDLAVELGVDPDDRYALQWVRSSLVAACAAAGVGAPIDGVTTRLDDDDVLRADSLEARRLGLTAKMCIHPRQVGIVHDAYRPTASELSWARDVVAAGGGGGVSSVNGQMVDAPVIARAQRVLARCRDCAPETTREIPR